MVNISLELVFRISFCFSFLVSLSPILSSVSDPPDFMFYFLFSQFFWGLGSLDHGFASFVLYYFLLFLFYFRRCRINRLLITRALNLSSSAMEELVCFPFLFCFKNSDSLFWMRYIYLFLIFLICYVELGILSDVAIIFNDSCWLHK